jgi:hypothetical protein
MCINMCWVCATPQQFPTSPFTSKTDWYTVCISYVFLKTISFSGMTKYCYPPQGIASLFVICLFIGFQSLYATLVCVACSQLEKLAVALSDIRQTHVTLQQDSEDRARQQTRQGQTHISVELFHHMQKQLNDCIRHHQQIKQYVYEK